MISLHQNNIVLTMVGHVPTKGNGLGYACRGVRRLRRPYTVLDAAGHSGCSGGYCHQCVGATTISCLPDVGRANAPMCLGIANASLAAAATK